MKVWELIAKLDSLPAGMTVRVVENSNGQYGDIISFDIDGDDADGIASIIFNNENEEVQSEAA